jgi:RND family efflux transporter MFP subunit
MPNVSRWDRWFALALLGAGIAGLAGLPMLGLRLRTGDDERKEEAKLTQRSGTSIKLGAKLAELYGIQTQAARAQTWQPRLTVYGRVVPNPRATAELRAPFAGTVQATAHGWPGIGAQADAGQELAIVQARFSPQERLDLQSKALEAEEKLKGADESVKVHQERVKRLESVSGLVAQTELELAKVQLTDARAARAGAQAQVRLWQQALKNLERQPVALTLAAPVGGEVVEIGVLPGTAVEAGIMLLKLVDFRRVLLRLDFPVGQALPPADLDIAMPAPETASPRSLTARRTGAAPAIDTASQYAGYYYEARPPRAETTWRPGLFVQAEVADLAGQPTDAAIVPATALLYHLGRALVYVQLNPGRFERREVQVLGRDGDVVFLGRGIRPGDQIVTRHAQLLLSEEFRGDADDD